MITLDGHEGVPLALAVASQNAIEMLRVDAVDERAVSQAWTVLRGGAALLAKLPGFAVAAAASHGACWQTLLASASGGSTSGSARMARTPPRPHPGQPHRSSFGAAQTDAEGANVALRKLALVDFEGGEEAFALQCAVAEALRGLLRLSLCDDADLALANCVVRESAEFFEQLETYAATNGVSMSRAWVSLLNFPLS